LRSPQHETVGKRDAIKIAHLLAPLHWCKDFDHVTVS
jgi:hypothetical protein